MTMHSLKHKKKPVRTEPVEVPVHPELVEGTEPVEVPVHPELVEGTEPVEVPVHPELVEGTEPVLRQAQDDRMLRGAGLRRAQPERGGKWQLEIEKNLKAS
jgi:hypothetical protein